ncbi:rhodanese-like domain-containing protein [Leptolyngbya sp. PCC 6406]|uniref:rhodanese-like domain-containing protein n=1 Tax=Leptolyngbya sp. PCC 6406 TaxID=1173264 RepID=UPI00048909A3|nr:rhodanese-like domain-containing protein [Leptolyngbya sp. PCC 6406]
MVLALLTTTTMLFGLLSSPKSMRPESRIYDLKARLDWGQPALTIIDLRSRERFNESHVTGAISLPMAEAVNRILTSLEFERDLYVYADTDEEATVMADQLRQAGYQRVSVLRGGTPAWKAAGFPIESAIALSQ